MVATHDQIEFEEPRYSVCKCCGETSTHLVRYVSRNGDAFSVYFADFSTGHEFVSVLASFGNWDEDAPTAERVAFAMRIWIAKDSYQVSLVDAEDSGYSDGVMGTVLSREEALGNQLKTEAFALSDHIVECDQPVIAFLNGTDG